MKKSQRFIAGAACPSCQATDALLVDLNDQSIECVECGFQQTEAERDAAKNQSAAKDISKSAPKKVDVSSIIRVTEIKSKD